MAARRPALIAKKVRKPRVSYNEAYLVNKKYLGDEPDLRGELTDSDYGRALNWYNYMATLEEGREYLITYLNSVGRKDEAKATKRIPDSRLPPTICWIARMISRGTTMPGSSIEFFNARLKEAFQYAVQREEAAPKNVISIQDRMREKASEIVGDVEQLIDIGEPFSLYDWMKGKELPAAYCNSIIEFYAPILNEYIEAFEGKDDQLKEGYSHLTKKQLKDKIFQYNQIIEDCQRYSNVTKKTRAPRKPRAQSKEKILKHFKYQKEDNQFKIASVNPDKIMGANELWTFNTKTKVVTVFRAMGPAGLQVNRSSIAGYDDKASFSRGTGRQTEKVLDKIQNGGKIVLRKLIDELKTAKALQARINENTIIMKVVQ